MRYWSSLPALFFGLRFLGNGMNRPPTIEIRPGYQFNVMVTQDLVFPGLYAKRVNDSDSKEKTDGSFCRLIDSLGTRYYYEYFQKL
jgi:hypothetical protein